MVTVPSPWLLARGGPTEAQAVKVNGVVFAPADVRRSDAVSS